MELGNQIAKLMAALTRAGQGNSLSSAPNSPRQRGCGEDRQTGTLLVAPVPIMARLAWDRPPQPTVYLSVVAQRPQVKARDRMPKGPKRAREAPQIGRIPAPSSASGAKVGATWLRNVPPQQRL